MKKNFLIGLVIMCMVIIGGKIYAEKESNQKETNSKEEVKIPVASKEYLDAYNLFMAANVTDVGECNYSRAIEALEKASQTTKDPEEKLKCVFLMAFSYFVDGKPDQAYKTALESLSLAKTVFADNANISLLEKVKVAIENKEITKISEVVSILNLGEEGAGLVMDLYQLQETREGYKEMVQKCWEKCKPAFDKKISSLIKELNISVEDAASIKAQLESKYSQKGYFLPEELEKSLTEFGLNKLLP